MNVVYSATFGDANLLGKFLDNETFDMKQGLPLHQCNPEVPIKKALASRVSSSSTPSTPSSRSAAALVRGTPWQSTPRCPWLVEGGWDGDCFDQNAR